MEDEAPQKGSGYGKRPLWQWIAIYLVAGAIIYGLIYYFVAARNGGYTTDTENPEAPSTQDSLY